MFKESVSISFAVFSLPPPFPSHCILSPSDGIQAWHTTEQGINHETEGLLWSGIPDDHFNRVWLFLCPLHLAATALIEGKLGKGLKKVLKKIVAKDAHTELAVADARLGNVIKVCYSRKEMTSNHKLIFLLKIFTSCLVETVNCGGKSTSYTNPPCADDLKCVLQLRNLMINMYATMLYPHLQWPFW